MTKDTTPRSARGHKHRKPNGRWAVSVQCGYRADGSPRRIWRSADTEEQADAIIASLLAELGERPLMARGVTLSALWGRYLAERGPKLARKTVASYTWVMSKAWLPLWADRDVTTIGRADVQREMLRMTRSMADRSRRVLSTVLTFGVRVGALDANPVRRGGFELPGAPARVDESAFDADPFAAIEGTRDVWDARTVLRCVPLIRGLPLEPAWLAIVGAGLRVEEALALRRADIRRVEIAGREVTQLAVHHARTDMDDRKPTKTAQSVRIVAVMEPFGARLWELACELDDRAALLCPVSAERQNARWRSYFAEPRTHRRMAESRRVSGRLRGLPYIPLSRMRATHATLMQEAGVLDSLNAAIHGHSTEVAYAHYKRADTTGAAEQTERYLRLVV